MWVRGKLRVNAMAQYEDPAYGTQITLMQSAQLRARALERLKNQNPNFAVPRDAQGKPASASIRASQSKGAAIFSLECMSEDPGYAEVFLNALMEEFLTYKEEIRAATAGDLLASVSDQVYKQERALQTEQEKLSQFQVDNNLVLLDEEVRNGGNQLAQYNSQIASLRLELSLLDAAALEKNVGSEVETNLTNFAGNPSRALALAGAGSGIPNEPPGERQRLESLRIQQQQLARYLRPKHPKMLKLSEEIVRGERLLQYFTAQSKEQLAIAKEAKQMRIAGLKAAVAELEVRVGAANRRYAEFLKIKAGVERQQSLYEQLLTLLRSVDLNRTIDQEEIAILERASKAVSAERPSLMVVIGAALAGTCAGLGIVFLVSRLDDRCDSLEDVRAHFSEEVYGQIPEIKARRFRQLALMQVNGDQQIFAESCRSLRSTILFNHQNGSRARTILVTSAVPDEGKSTIAVNLAQALALGGAKVLLVDGDLRRGHLHKFLKTGCDIGLTDLVLNSGRLESYATETQDANLTFLPRGKSVTDTGELFLRPAFDSFLEQAKQMFHYVIIDSVPIFAADDATTLAPKTDGVLFVVRRAYTSSRAAQEALSLLYQRRANVLGLIFNRADTRTGSYHYYKYAQYYSHSTTA
jgi:capsular exopolysaccharide synthesis family protein